MNFVSIIILSYNTEELTKRCLTAVFAHLKKGTFEVIVVDNNSADGSVNMIKNDFPQVRLMANDKNIGFAAGCNLGAKDAVGQYLLFLNSDIELEKDILPDLLTVFEKHSEAGVVGCQLVHTDGSPQRSYGEFYALGSVFRLLFGGEKAELKRFTATGVQKVDWVSGGCLVIKKDLFEAIEGFDDNFFMYIEDMELCYRVREKGSAVYFSPEIHVKHVGQGSSNKTFAIVQIYKGLQYFYKKHANPLQYTMVKLLLAVKALLSLSVGVVTGNSYLKKTYAEAWQTL